MKDEYVDMINDYLNHPCNKIIKNYFGEVRIYEDGLTYVYEIKSIDFKYRRLYKIVNLNYKEHLLKRMIDLNMKDIVKSLVYVMMDDYFDPKLTFVEFNKIGELVISLKASGKTHHQRREITINGKTFILSSKVRVEDRKIELFKIDMNDFSFDVIKTQLDDVSSVKDQVMTALIEE